MSPCTYDGTGDTGGGWTYAGQPGFLEIELAFTSDGSDVGSLAVQATFEAPARVEFDQELIDDVIPPDVDITDRCTPQERAESVWSFAVET